MFTYQVNELGIAAALHGENTDQAIVQEYAQDDDLIVRCPTSLARFLLVKHRLITFHRLRKRFPALLFESKHRTDETEETLNGRRRGQPPKAGAITRHTQDEIINQFTLGSRRQTARVPD